MSLVLVFNPISALLLCRTQCISHSLIILPRQLVVVLIAAAARQKRALSQQKFSASRGRVD